MTPIVEEFAKKVTGLLRASHLNFCLQDTFSMTL